MDDLHFSVGNVEVYNAQGYKSPMIGIALNCGLPEVLFIEEAIDLREALDKVIATAKEKA